MSSNIKKQIVEKMKSHSKFPLQVDESANTSHKPQFLGIIRFTDDKDIHEQFLFCTMLETTTISHNMFVLVTFYLNDQHLPLRDCCCICTDDASSMSGKYCQSFEWKSIHYNNSPFFSSSSSSSSQRGIICESL